MEELLKKYRDWLSLKYTPKVVSDNISRLKRISQSYDIIYEYTLDHCANLIDLFTYTKYDQNMGEEPKADIRINGDYYNGLASLKHAIVNFVDYLNHAKYVQEIKKRGVSAVFTGSFEEFIRFVGPKCRNEVNIFCKSEREKHNRTCEFCGATGVLESAHIVERPEIIKNILESHFKKSPDFYVVDLYEFFKYFKNAHMPIKDHILFLCKTCHNALDKKGTITLDDIRAKRRY